MRVLIVSSFLPFPPDSGSRIRTWEIACRIRENHDVTFAVHVRSSTDMERAEEMRWHGFQVVTGWINTGIRFLSTALVEVLSGGVPLFALRRSHDLEEQLRQIQAAHPFDVIQIEHFELARYARLIGGSSATIRSIVLHDVLSVAYARMATVERNPCWRLWRMYNSYRLAKYERLLLGDYNLCVTVSPLDCYLVSSLCTPGPVIRALPNCVDSTRKPFLEELSLGLPNLLFVGLFLHPPNSDAAIWMAEDILPHVRVTYPECTLSLVGADPTHRLKRIIDQRLPGVNYIGHVDDVEPSYRQCDLAVVPIRSAGGTRLKILEAMAFGRAVVSTTTGAEGLEVEAGKHLLIADDAETFARAIVRLLCDTATKQRLQRDARKLVETKYNWDDCAATQIAIYEELIAGVKRQPLCGTLG